MFDHGQRSNDVNAFIVQRYPCIQISGFEGQLVVVKGAVDNSVYAITESDPPLQMPQKIPISTTYIRQYASLGDMNVDLAVP